MTRQEANWEIIQLLSDLVEEFPEWRFGQLLVNARVWGFKYGSVENLDGPVAVPLNEFNTESEVTLKRLEAAYKEMMDLDDEEEETKDA